MRILLRFFLITIITSIPIYIASIPIKNINVDLNSKAILEGYLFKGGGGGTREIISPFGYMLRDTVWILKPQMNFEDKIILISSNNLPLESYVNKYVHVEGKIFDIPTEILGEARSIYAHYKIVADTIYVTDANKRPATVGKLNLK